MLRLRSLTIFVALNALFYSTLSASVHRNRLSNILSDRLTRRTHRTHNSKHSQSERLEIEGNTQQEENFGDVLGEIFETIRETTREVTSVGTDVLSSLGLSTENDGFGGAIGGAFNLLSVGADIVTGVASHVLGGGDLLSGLVPGIG